MFETRPPTDAHTERRRVRRDVVSFVRRSPRMNTSQVRNWDAHHERFVVNVLPDERSTSIAEHAQLDLAALFGRSAPVIVEIGSGTGDSLAAMAEQRPEANIVAFEVFQPAVANTLGKLDRAGLANVRLIMADAAQGLERLFEPAGLGELWIFFPDPRHKARHHKRRIVSTEFADLAASRLRPGGLWRLATDWDDYAAWMRDVLDPHAAFENVHGEGDGWAPRLAERPVTKFEQRGLDAGRTIRDLTYRRRP